MRRNRWTCFSYPFFVGNPLQNSLLQFSGRKNIPIRFTWIVGRGGDPNPLFEGERDLPAHSLLKIS
jgi:hypothetical protein